MTMKYVKNNKLTKNWKGLKKWSSDINALIS